MNNHKPLALLNTKYISKTMRNHGSFTFNSNEERLLKINAGALVAMENASELIKSAILHQKKFIEKVLKYVSENSTFEKTTYVPSIVVPLNTVGNNNNNKQLKSLQAKITKLKTTHDYIMTIVAIDFKNGNEEGAHYAAYYYNTNDDMFYYFDSMQQHKAGSSFSPKFKKIGIYLFSTNKGKLSKCMQTKSESYQYTGGFITEGTHLNLLQSIDSQHHFCYMEALLHLAEIFINYNVPSYKKPNVRGSGLIRLVAIKRWIWCLVHMFASDVLQKDMKLYNYLKQNFMVIWYNKQLRFTNKSEWYLPGASKLNHIQYQVYKIKNSNLNKLPMKDLRSILNYVHNHFQIE